MESKIYGTSLAELYDSFNADADYTSLCDFTETVFKRYCVKKPSYICEIACGTGNTAKELAKRGYKIIASDISEEMLTVADKKAREAGADIRFVKADMKYFELYSKVDAVVCFFDSINYLTSKNDVISCFRHVYSALNDGGVFIFDINSRYKFEKVYADNAYVIEEEGNLCAWQNYYNPSTRICDFYLSIFTQSKGGMYFRDDENQREKMYTERQIRGYLSDSGFEIIGCFSNYDFVSGNEFKDDRLFFVCRKPGAFKD